jgi:hypothetical protein
MDSTALSSFMQQLAEAPDINSFRNMPQETPKVTLKTSTRSEQDADEPSIAGALPRTIAVLMKLYEAQLQILQNFISAYL